MWLAKVFQECNKDWKEQKEKIFSPEFVSKKDKNVPTSSLNQTSQKLLYRKIKAKI